MKSKRATIFSVVVLSDLEVTDDLGGCLTVSCTNLTGLSLLTGISRDRLAYVFTRKRQNVLLEDGHFIIKSSELYRGNQSGREKGTVYTGINR